MEFAYQGMNLGGRGACVNPKGIKQTSKIQYFLSAPQITCFGFETSLCALLLKKMEAVFVFVLLVDYVFFRSS